MLEDVRDDNKVRQSQDSIQLQNVKEKSGSTGIYAHLLNNHGPTLPHLDLNQAAGVSTNTWSQLIPSGRLPEQIHNGGESQGNVRQLLAGLV